MKAMKNSLCKNGIFLVSAPSEPHEMVSFVNDIQKIPYQIMKTLKFYKKILLPFLKKNGKANIYKKKINYINFNKEEDFLSFWKNTTYYNSKIYKKVQKFLKIRKNLKFKKVSTIVAAIKK